MSDYHYKQIKYGDKIYELDEETGSYLHHIEGNKYLLLVYLEEDENWKGYNGAWKIHDAVADKYGINIDKDHHAFESFVINYEYYETGIQYLKYYPCDSDAGSNDIAFDLKAYLETYEMEIYDKIADICKGKGDVTWGED